MATASDDVREGIAADTLALLSGISTATLSMQLLKRGFRNVFMRSVRPLAAAHARFAAPAYTLRNIPAREDLARPEILADPQYPQRRAIEEAPPGHALVVDCRGDDRAGIAGDILVRRLMVRSVAALVADGPVRDARALSDMDFPIHCAGEAAPASINAHLAVDVQTPIACGGVAVFPGDVVVGDGDGVVVVPRHLVADVARDGAEQERLERFVQMKIAAGSSIVGVYPPGDATRDAYRRWVDEGEPGF